ncbi:hypothetical protein E4S40_10780 [Algoriphagus kandeliae]|uniref:Phospholipase D-like domain-containing protein n=1 Tax=Algoriphagus kandeliae TaxID=2562278 RepID=A0A4Y9QQM2_9BACT|nr:hypothetical protein [Algoriphagus kandeliae]TFV94497.1 hypothetical protein E4S40_10780 [Algoriphagus kandeliae]
MKKMKIYKNGLDLSKKIIEFLNRSQRIYIFSPYIRIEALVELIKEKNNVNAVFVRWEPNDLIRGSSDLEIYPFLKEKGISLFRNRRLHLKAYIDEYKRCFLTTANISSRALNIPHHDLYNYEIGTIVENLNIEDRLYFSLIENESTLITDNIYNQIKEQLSEKKDEEFSNEFDFDLTFENSDKDFLISSLPMSFSVDKLYSIYHEKKYDNEEELNCALHDIALYKIPLGLTYDNFRNLLSHSFFNHPFINGFLENLGRNREIYFGAAKEWIHYNCADVPTPRRWEITENIQILYRWIVELGNGKYEVDRPNYSERLKIK